MPRIEELYAWVIADTGPDDEGVPAFTDPATGYWMPMMGADMDRAEQLRRMAQQLADRFGQSVKLIRSTGIEVVEVVEPKFVDPLDERYKRYT